MQNSDRENNPLVSVILPTYNMAEHVVESVESILGQTLQDFELVIINDGSTDDTETRLGSVVNHPKIVYRAQDNRGVAAALNHGIRIARGEFIAIQNADDISLPTRLEEQAKILAHDPEVEMVYCQAIFLYGDGRAARVRKGLPGNLSKEQAFYRLFLENSEIHYAVMFRRRHFAGREPFSETYWIGTDYLHHLKVAHDYRIQGIEHPLIKMRRGEHQNRLTGDYEQSSRDIRSVLWEVYTEFRDRPPRVSRSCYRKAMSHAYLGEARFFLKRRQYGLAVRRILRAFLYRLVNPKGATMLFKLPLKMFLANFQNDRSTAPDQT